jgi:hypothetical protein
LDTLDYINENLKAFIKKYYSNELIKGFLLFISIGFIYFFVTLIIEHFLWLSTFNRSLLFWLFILVELSLFYKFIGIPLFKLLGLKKRLSKEEASQLIGNHFPEVNDKLTNLLQLQDDNDQSELLLASINQKAAELSPIPFKIAINFKKNSTYLKYVAIPFIIYFIIQLTGNQYIINNSYKRVINHDIAYSPPAPFNFILINSNLEVLENKSFILEVTTKGKVVPDNLKINLSKNESYYLSKIDFNKFRYEFPQLNNDIIFSLEANDIISKDYKISVLKVPTILNFEMQLNYPSYIAKKNKIIKNTGNITVPEGTNITWNINTKTTDEVLISLKDSTYNFIKETSNFKFKKNVFSTFDYEISTSNAIISDYDKLRYKVKIVKDEYPEINIQSKKDSLNTQVNYFFGKVSDDYGLSKLQLIYKELNSDVIFNEDIKISNSNFDQFTYIFPGNLKLKKGVSYEYYFEVFDNDKLHNYKKSKSEVFNFQKLTLDDLENNQLDNQKENINNLIKSLDNLSKKDKFLKDINQLQKEKNSLNWNDKNKINDFLNKQENQDQLLKKINKDLQKNLDEFQNKNIEDDIFKEELKERLKNQEKELNDNEKLFDELKKLQDKLQDEDLFDKINKLSKKNKNQDRSLEQILELTKRFYISKKFEKISEKLDNLANKQNELANKIEKNNTKEKQDKLNAEFDKVKKDLLNLDKENNELKSPMNLDNHKDFQEDITNEQNKASDKLKNNKKQKAKANQKSAAQKMKEMSDAMQLQMQSSSSEQLEEDEKMLRQILDNLISYSFDQENLLYDFKNLNNSNFEFTEKLKYQYTLKDHFNHIDDSLFVLSLRIPKLSENINLEISNVHSNLNKSLERFADQKIYLGVSNQQYALTAANNLANLLSSVLQSLQNDLNKMKIPGAGSCTKPGGNSPSFQLSDIIKKQGELNKKMGEAINLGKDGSSGKDGKSRSKGNSGSNGKPSKSGYDSNNNVIQDNSGNLYDIYKEQQQLKNLFKELINNATNPLNSNLIKKMDDISNDLLENGFNDDILKKMNEVKHQLLKLNKASFQQGDDFKRKSDSNTKVFNSNQLEDKLLIKQYFNEIEILNRQVLPLQPNYKLKVKEYFNFSND